MKLLPAVLSTILALAGSAHAAIVERVVAVVGDQPVWMSEVHARARPHLRRIYASPLDPARQAAAETALYRELLERMIDERIEESAATRAHVTVTAAEVDAALVSVAAAGHLDVAALLVEAAKQGLAEQEYKDELGRQILEGKLLHLRVRAGADEWEAARRAWLRAERGRVYVDVRL